MVTHSVVDVAAEIRRRVPGVATMRLHKLLYYCQGYHLADVGEPLFDETISAFDKGPLVGQLWYRERDTGLPADPVAPLGEPELNTIGYVISRYGQLSGNELGRLTHTEDPWVDADERRRSKGKRSQRIPAEQMRVYFARPDLDDELTALTADDSDIDAWLSTLHGAPDRELPVDTAESLRDRLR